MRFDALLGNLIDFIIPTHGYNNQKHAIYRAYWFINNAYTSFKQLYFAKT